MAPGSRIRARRGARCAKRSCSPPSAARPTGCARHALPPAPVAAFDPGETRGSTAPAFYWIPAWRIYLREGDVVEHRGRQYTIRAGQWLGDGRFIHATRSGDTVRVSALDEDWFRQRWVGARRLRAARDR